MNIFTNTRFRLAIFCMVMGTVGWTLPVQTPIGSHSGLPAEAGMGETSAVLQVVDETGATIGRAHITVRNENGQEILSTYADQDGMLKISSLPADSYVVWVSADFPGFLDVDWPFSIRPGKTQEIKIVLNLRCDAAFNCHTLVATPILIEPILATSPTMIEPYVLQTKPTPRKPGFFKRLISRFRHR